MRRSPARRLFLVLAIAASIPLAPAAAGADLVQVDNSAGNTIAEGAVLRGDPVDVLVTVSNRYHFWAAIDLMAPIGRAELRPASLLVDFGGIYAAGGLIAPSATAAYQGRVDPGGSQNVRVHYDFTSAGGLSAIAANVLTIVADSLGAGLRVTSVDGLQRGLRILMSTPGYAALVRAIQQPKQADIWSLVRALKTLLGTTVGRAAVIAALAEFNVTATEAQLARASSVVGLIDWAWTLKDLLIASWGGHTDGMASFWRAAPRASGTPTPTPTPTPTLQAPPAPRNLQVALDCMWLADPGTVDCGLSRTWPVRVTWEASKGVVTGYRVYRTAGSIGVCPGDPAWTPKGSPRLVAKIPADTTSWAGSVTAGEAQITVVAVNPRGSSPPTAAPPFGLYPEVACAP